jgi:hypothetical protein
MIVFHRGIPQEFPVCKYPLGFTFVRIRIHGSPSNAGKYQSFLVECESVPDPPSRKSMTAFS